MSAGSASLLLCLLLNTSSSREAHVDLETVVDHPLETSQGSDHDDTAEC